MDSKAPDSLMYNEQDFSSQNTTENVLKLVDPPGLHSLATFETEANLQDNAENSENIDDTSDDLLHLSDPPQMGNDCDNETAETVEISKFAEEFVDPIVKEAIAMHNSEIEDEANDSRGESVADKKSDKGSSDDGFVFVKDEEVEKIEVRQDQAEEPNDDGDSMKKMLDEIVFQEEMRPGDGSDDREHDFTKPMDVHMVEAKMEEIIREEIPEVSIEELINEVVTEAIESPAESEPLYQSEPFDADAVKSPEEAEPTDQNEDIDAEMVESPGVAEPIDQSELIDAENHEEAQSVDIPMKKEVHVNENKEEQGESLDLGDHDIVGKCKDIISWAHPVSSALAFTILMFIELGLLMEYSIISLLAYSGLLLMLASLVFKVAASFRLINTQATMNCVITFNKEDVEYCVNVTLRWLDYLHKEIKSIAYVDSFSKNIKVFTMLWVLTYVGQMFNLQSLICIGSLLLFSVPVVYARFESEIDDFVGTVRGHVCGNIYKMKSRCQRLMGSG